MTNWKLAVNWWTQQSLGFDFFLKRDALTGTSISDVAERRKVTSNRGIFLKYGTDFTMRSSYEDEQVSEQRKIANVLMKLAMLYLSYELLYLYL